MVEEEELQVATDLGQLRGRNSNEIIGEIEDTQLEGCNARETRAAHFIDALAFSTYIRTTCLREKTCVFCLAKNLMRDGEY